MADESTPAAPATPPAGEPAKGDKESVGDKLKDIAGEIKDKGEELVDKVKDKLDKDDDKKA